MKEWKNMDWIKCRMNGWEKGWLDGGKSIWKDVRRKEWMNEMMNERLKEYGNERMIGMNGGRKRSVDEVTEEGRKGWKREELKKDGFVELELMKGLGLMVRVRIDRRVRVCWFGIAEGVRVNGEG